MSILEAIKRGLVSPMNVMADLDGTLERFPEFYKTILVGHTFPGERIILTARPNTERNLTVDKLREMGVYGPSDDHVLLQDRHYDRLIMFPQPYLFAFSQGGKPSFYKDNTGIKQYRNLIHRNDILQGLIDNSLSETLDNDTMHQAFAEWKTRVCLAWEISVAFEDSAVNTEHLRKAGIYVCHVDWGYKGGTFGGYQIGSR